MGEYKVAIIIPAFNEDATILRVVDSVKEYGCPIVVNDGSTDNTQAAATKSGAIVVNHLSNQGYDNALNSGFIEADKRNFDAIITFDADGQHCPTLLKIYIDKLKKGADLVLGVRPKPARFAEAVFMLYTRLRFSWKDPLCGMKGYSIGLYRNQGYFDSYNSIGTQLALYGLFNKYSFVQINIPIYERYDRPRFSSALKSNIRIFNALIKSVNI
jgi:glycosyltransferase involved in cell wall biosynthesis